MIKLTQKCIQSLFTYREGNLYWKNVNNNRIIKNGDKSGSLNKDGYYYVKINSKRYKSHRLIFLYHYGYLPKELDHIDGDRGNNLIENLQDISHRNNIIKSINKSKCLSQYFGVTWDKSRNKWLVQIQIKGKIKHLGRFGSETDAALAYNEKVLELFGKYAKLNEI